MKKFVFVLGITLFSSYSFSQINSVPQNYQDSLNLAKSLIDQLGYTDLSKQRERFTYLNREQPSQINKEILIYIEEKYKKVKP
jgi:ABC-type transport system substrate-binding protein